MRQFLSAILIAGLLLGKGIPALADDDTCASVGRIAESVMQRRQDGLSLQSTLVAAKGAASAVAYAALEDMIVAAYDTPLYSTEKHKTRAIGTFRDARQLVCMKALRAGKQP